MLVMLLLYRNTVESCYNEDLGTMKITLLNQVSCYMRVKKQRITKVRMMHKYVSAAFMPEYLISKNH